MWNVVKIDDTNDTQTIMQTVEDEQNARDLAQAYTEHCLPYWMTRCKYVVEAAE